MRTATVKIIVLCVALAGVGFLTACGRSTNTPGGAGSGSAGNVSTNPDLTQPNPGLLLIVSPSTGPAAGGTAVKLTGENFTGTPKLLFGTAEAKDVKVVSKTEITAVTPAGTKGKAVDITLQAPSAPTSTLVEAFTYQ